MSFSSGDPRKGPKHCVLCGVKLYRPIERAPTWLKCFRALFTSNEKPSPAISGKGRYTDFRANEGGAWVALSDYDRPYTEGNAGPDEGTIVSLLIGNCKTWDRERHGFPFHASCWHLLEKAYDPLPVPLGQLYDLLVSLPVNEWKLVDWGHDYAGAIDKTCNDILPYETIISVPDRLPDWLQADPQCCKQVEPLLTKTPEPLPTVLKRSHGIDSKHDSFSVLPQDLRLMIANEISSSDVWNLRLASRSFYFLFHDQHFWAARFRDDRERSWLMKVAGKLKSMPRDWRYLYHRANKANLNRGLLNCERIWGLIQVIQRMLPLEPLGSTYYYDASDNYSWGHWMGVGGRGWNMLPEGLRLRDFPDGPVCCTVRERQMISPGTDPDPLLQVKVYLCELPEADYVAGLELVFGSEDNPNDYHRLGYKTAKVRRVHAVGSLFGFNTAVGPRGIRALQCIFSNGELSPWLGDPAGVPITKRLGFHAPLGEMEAAVDACKLLSISLQRNEEEKEELHKELDAYHRSVLNCALWYPDVPSEGLHLNQGPNPMPKSVLEGFNPLRYVLFGGAKGCHLQFMTGMSVMLERVYHRKVGGSLIQMCGIKFHYSNSSIPIGDREFIHEGSHNQARGQLLPEIYFPVDGAGGERIEHVQRCFYIWRNSSGPYCYCDPEFNCKDHECWQPENLPSGIWDSAIQSTIQVTTNRGRTCLFATPEMESDPERPLVKRTLEVVPGTTIVGFYGSKENHLWGIISQDVGNE